MRSFLTLLVVAAACIAPAFAQARSDIAISLSPSTIRVGLREPVTIDITITNIASAPRYVARTLLDRLQYGIKDASGHALCPPSHPPTTPPTLRSEEDWVWLRPGQTIQVTQRLSQKDLCIGASGTFFVYGALNGQIATDAQHTTGTVDFFFTGAKPIKVVVSHK